MSNIQPVGRGGALAGTERYGTVHGTAVEARMPTFVQAGTQLAPPSGVPYTGKYQSCAFIKEDNTQCKGPKAKGTEFCIGHLRSIEKALKEQAKEETPAEQIGFKEWLIPQLVSIGTT